MLLFIAWAIPAAIYFALLSTGLAVKRWRVQLWTAEIPVAIVAALLQFLAESYVDTGVWLLCAALATSSVFSARRVRDFERGA